MVKYWLSHLEEHHEALFKLTFNSDYWSTITQQQEGCSKHEYVDHGDFQRVVIIGHSLDLAVRVFQVQ